MFLEQNVPGTLLTLDTKFSIYLSLDLYTKWYWLD